MFWCEDTTTTITAHAWRQCRLPGDNWMSLIVYPMRSRSQPRLMGTIRKAFGCSWYHTPQLPVRFWIAFDCLFDSSNKFNPLDHLDVDSRLEYLSKWKNKSWPVAHRSFFSLNSRCMTNQWQQNSCNAFKIIGNLNGYIWFRLGRSQLSAVIHPVPWPNFTFSGAFWLNWF